ncbi:MAG TPA: hypothetical protein VGW78_04170 [Candidatus Babeliales bacterium]|jgi:hypothetical protein|nr:hypothetical protein [Candidatus Babeliales bacterium]
MYKLIGLYISVVAFSAYAMEQNPEWRSWVKNTSVIYISSITKNYPGEMTIENNTTIRDIKHQLYKNQGIPVDHQCLAAVWQVPWTLGLIRDKSAVIQDDLLIKDVMDNYNTRNFELTLMRPNNNQILNYPKK